MTDVTGRLFDLITEHESIEGLLNDLTDGGSDWQLKALSNPTFVGLESLIENQCRLTGSSLPSTSANILCSVLKSSFAKSEQKLYLETSEERAKLNVIISVGKHFSISNKFSSRIFAKNLNKKDETYLPFEVIWMLHKSSLMTLDLYFLCNLEHPEVINDLSRHLGLICCKEVIRDIETRRTMLLDVLACLLKTSSVGDVNDVMVRGLKKVSQALLDNILKKLLSLKEREQDINMFGLLNTKYLQQGGADDFLPGRETMEKFYLRQAVIIITKKGDEGFSAELFSKHQKWTFLEMNKNLRSLFEELLVMIKVEDLFPAFQKLLEQKEFDWKNGLMFVSVLLVCFQKFASLVEGLISDMIGSSLQCQDHEGLGSAFLVARHCCLQGHHVYMPYNVWFKKTFKEEGRINMNRKSLSFLIKFLTSIIPKEAENFIKVHIQNPPVIPQKSRDEWFDYVALAKTHLSDLKSDVDVATLELEQQEILERVEREIESALESFKKDNKLPSFLVELSLFSRPYFIGKFLPVLMKPRLLPGMPDERMQLISALNRSQKIPSNMLQKYEDECKRMALELVEGVIGFGDDDDDAEMQMLQLPWLDQLRISLKNLQDSVLSGSGESLTKCLSHVSEKLFATSKNSRSPVVVSDEVVVVDVVAVDLSDYQFNGGELCQTSHMVLEFILQTTFLCPPDNPNNALWLDKLILMLSNHKEVLAQVYRIAGNLISNKSSLLSPCHYDGLGHLFFQRIHADAEIYGIVKFGGKHFLEYVEDLVKFRDADQLRQMIAFVCSYVTLVLSRCDGRKLVATADDLRGEPDFVVSMGFIPRAFVDVLTFGLPKIEMQFRSFDDDDVRNCIEGMEDQCQMIALDFFFVKKIFCDPMTFKKWMKYETSCNDTVEDFSVVNDYFAWVVHSGKYVLSDGHDEQRSRLEKYCVEVFETLCYWDGITSTRCFKCCEDQKSGKEDKFLCFVYLLQNLASHANVSRSCLPWIWEGVDRVFKNLAEQLPPDAAENEKRFSEMLITEKIIKLLTMLTPSLLISNSTTTVGSAPDATNRGLARLISFINSNLRNSSSRSFLALDFNLTLHILQCLSTVTSSDLMEFFTGAPLFTFSVFHHWKSILFSDVFAREDCRLKNIFSGIQHSTSSNVPIDPKVAAALFLGLGKNSVEAFSASVEIASCIHQTVAVGEKKISFTSISDRLETRPDLFVEICRCSLSGKDGKILCLTLPDFVLSMWTCAMMTTFVHLAGKEQFCQSSALSVEFLNTILRCYKDFNDFFDTPGIDRSALYSRPFATLGEASQALVNYFVKAPKIKLKDIDEDVLNDSDVLIKSCISKYRR